jgi:GNAT superfamily N-acetyltransferase
MPALGQAEIRQAREGDAELLLGLIRELADYERAVERVTGDAELLHRALFEQRTAEALVLELDGEAIGYAIFFTTFSTWECRPGIWLEDVFVRPQHRRGGLGRALLARIAALAVERGYPRLDWCALKWNEPALRFYERIGAEPLEEWQLLRLEGEALRRLGQADDCSR